MLLHAVRVIWNFPARSVIEASARLSCSSTPRRVASTARRTKRRGGFRYTEPCGSVYSRSTGGVQEETKPLGNGFPVRRARGQRHDFPTHNQPTIRVVLCGLRVVWQSPRCCKSLKNLMGLRCHGRGREFESRRPRHFFKEPASIQ